MARVRNKDAAAFQELYDTHSDLVFSVAMKILADPAAAQDVMQEVFLRIWNAAALYDPALGRVVSWIVTITRHQSLNRIRSEQRRSTAHHHSASEAGAELAHNDAAEPGRLLIQSETAAAVQNSLQSLPPDQSEAIRLAFFQNMTHESAASLLNVPLGTLKARIRRGLLRLQEQLQFVR